MVGLGRFRPDFSLIRPDTPKALQNLMERCIRFNRDDRPEFKQVGRILCKIEIDFQVLHNLETISNNLPKLKRSTSEPLLYRTHLQQDDFLYPLASPRTPINIGNNFPLFNATGNTNSVLDL
jgi:pole hole protein